MKKALFYYDGTPAWLNELSPEELDKVIAEEQEKSKEFQKRIDALNGKK